MDGRFCCVKIVPTRTACACVPAPSCCAPCNTGGVVIPTKCGIGYYGTYPNCTKCPAGPNGEPTTSLGTSLTVSGCYIEIGTDFEDGTGYGEYVEMCHPF